MTLHRPSNVDDVHAFSRLLHEVCTGVRNFPVVFPVHPRTAKTLEQLPRLPQNLIVVSPQPYLEFNFLVKNAFCVVTDSGGITEETTVLKIPCITLRDTTERPETVTLGTNELVGTDPAVLPAVLGKLFSRTWKVGAIPEKWDGKAGERIARVLDELALRGRILPSP
jgi:UDP-N-acetylglucosamine 2-epimerase (non-hydrolysing)